MGFDFFYSYNCKWQAHTYYPPFLYRNECREYLENGIVHPDTPMDKGADLGHDAYDVRNWRSSMSSHRWS